MINEEIIKTVEGPVHLSLVPINTQFKNSELLVCAECAPFEEPNFHNELLNGKTAVIGCPLRDNSKIYEEKLIEIFNLNDFKRVTVAIMDVPCCSMLLTAVENAVKKSGKSIEIISHVIRM